MIFYQSYKSCSTLLNASASINDDVDSLVYNGVKKHRLNIIIVTKKTIVTIFGINKKIVLIISSNSLVTIAIVVLYEIYIINIINHKPSF